MTLSRDRLYAATGMGVFLRRHTDYLRARMHHLRRFHKEAITFGNDKLKCNNSLFNSTTTTTKCLSSFYLFYFPRMLYLFLLSYPFSKFRLPDGSTQNHTFKADDTLFMVRNYVAEQRPDLLNVQFTLSTTFPRKVFADPDASKTLKELRLVPSTVLVLAKKV